LPTAGNTSACGPVGTTGQALSLPSPSRSIPQRPPIGALLVAVSCAPRPTSPQPLPAPSTPGERIADTARLLPPASLAPRMPAPSTRARVIAARSQLLSPHWAADGVDAIAVAQVRRRRDTRALPPGTGIAALPQPGPRIPATASSLHFLPSLSVPSITYIAPLMRIMPLGGVDTAVPATLAGVWGLGGHGTPRDGGTRGC
jgi:hypothetical protein